MAALIQYDHMTKYARFAIKSEEELDILPTTIADGAAELSNVKAVAEGSIAEVTDEDNDHYILTGDGEWVKKKSDEPVPYDLIDDTTASTSRTYSSSKIEELVSGAGGGGSSYTKTELYDGTNGGQNPTGTALTLNTEITLAHDFKDYDEIWVEWCYLGSGLFLGVENIFTSDYLTACQAINASGTYQNLSEIVCMGYNNCYTFIPSADNKFLTKELLGTGAKQMMHIYGIKYGGDTATS